jgi:hypothetical protein
VLCACLLRLFVCAPSALLGLTVLFVLVLTLCSLFISAIKVCAHVWSITASTSFCSACCASGVLLGCPVSMLSVFISSFGLAYCPVAVYSKILCSCRPLQVVFVRSDVLSLARVYGSGGCHTKKRAKEITLVLSLPYGAVHRCSRQISHNITFNPWVSGIELQHLGQQLPCYGELGTR